MLPDKHTRDARGGDHTPTGHFARRQVTGSSHLAKRSDLSRSRARHGRPNEILIVDDEAIEAERLTATLHVLFGYQVMIRWARSLDDAIESLAERHPSITFLDDILKPAEDAFLSIPALRNAGYDGPIIVVSGAVTQSRRARLIASGASDVIDKDEVDSVRLAEAIDRAHSTDEARRRT